MPIVDGHAAHGLVDRDAGVVDEKVEVPVLGDHFVDDALAVGRLVDAAACKLTVHPLPARCACSSSAAVMLRL